MSKSFISIAVSKDLLRVLLVFIVDAWMLSSMEKRMMFNGSSVRTAEKTFNDLTLSPMSNSKFDTDVWLNYAKSMILGFSIRKSAKIVDIMAYPQNILITIFIGSSGLNPLLLKKILLRQDI
ncbi:MAG: hypothetical protein AB1Z23_08340 [Eubacteriales bacterium]